MCEETGQVKSTKATLHCTADLYDIQILIYTTPWTICICSSCKMPFNVSYGQKIHFQTSLIKKIGETVCGIGKTSQICPFWAHRKIKNLVTWIQSFDSTKNNIGGPNFRPGRKVIHTLNIENFKHNILYVQLLMLFFATVLQITSWDKMGTNDE